jgi:hypothetical protein
MFIFDYALFLNRANGRMSQCVYIQVVNQTKTLICRVLTKEQANALLLENYMPTAGHQNLI